MASVPRAAFFGEAELAERSGATHVAEAAAAAWRRNRRRDTSAIGTNDHMPRPPVRLAAAVDGQTTDLDPSAGLAGLPRSRARDGHRRADPRLIFLGLSQESLALDGHRLHRARLAADALRRGPPLPQRAQRRTA